MIKATIQFDKEQLKKVRKSIDLRKNAVKKRLSREMGKYLENVKATAQQIIRNEAFDTGRLHNSIKIRWDGSSMKGDVYADGRVAKNQDGESYTEYVEFGHFLFPYGNMNIPPRWIPGVYYMTRAVARHRSYKNVVRAALIDSFNHYDKGGDWYNVGKSVNYFAKTGRKLGGNRLQGAFGHTTKAGKALSSMRTRATRAKRARRAKNR